MLRTRIHALALPFAITLHAQTAPEAKPAPEKFTRQEVMVPTRDGAHLQPVIFTPKNASSPLPILLMRTHYGVPDDESRVLAPALAELNVDGYIWVSQNLPGRFKSEGKWEMQQSLCAVKTNCVDESTDADDTIDWNIGVGVWDSPGLRGTQQSRMNAPRTVPESSSQITETESPVLRNSGGHKPVGLDTRPYSGFASSHLHAGSPRFAFSAMK